MKIIITRSGYPSSRILRDALQEELDCKIIVTTQASKYAEIFLRYGNSDVSENIVTDTNFNSPEVIKLLSDKLLFSRLMQENGINSPIYYSSGTPENFPVVIRKGLCLSKGRGIFFAKNMDEFEKIFKGGNYWTPFLDMEYELRVHCVGESVIKILKKICRTDEPEFPIRTSDTYHFKKIDGGFSKLINLCESVSKIIGSGFVALDVGKIKGGSYTIIEGNSAPGLNLATAATLAKNLAERLKDDNCWARAYKE